jgi:hypothetical protein
MRGLLVSIVVLLLVAPVGGAEAAPRYLYRNVGLEVGNGRSATAAISKAISSSPTAAPTT